ncbi:MAG: hypothetical protein AAFP17_12310 [Pseudomonadota bacterium]
MHFFAGAIVMTFTPTGAISAILDGVDATGLAADYPDERSVILCQH